MPLTAPPLQLFPARLQLIASPKLPQILLDRFDQRLRTLKQEPDSTYQQALKSLWQDPLSEAVPRQSRWQAVWYGLRAHLGYPLLLGLLLSGSGILLLVMLWIYLLRRQIERRTAELKASQAEIAAHEARLRQIIEYAPVAMATADNKGQILQLNRAFTELLGYTSADLQHMDDWWPLAYPDPLYRQQQQADWPAELTKSYNSYEDLIHAKDGTPKNLLVRFQTLGSQRVFAFVDQSAQKLRESELVSSLQTSERILNATQEPARLGGWELDLQAGTVWWTDGLYYLHGLPADRSSLAVQEHVGASLQCYQPESARAELQQLFERCQQYGEPYDREYRFQPFQGPEIWVRAFAQPVLENGQVIRILGVVKDISAQKANEAALEQARSQAEQAAQTKALFLANMSHEIRTPMNAILGFSQLLQQQISDPRWREYLTIINDSGEHLLQLINEILDLSKIEAGKLVLNPEPLQLAELLEEIRFLLALGFETKGLDFSVSLSGEVPEWLLLDRQRLRQILLNLLSNALKFTDSGSVQLRAYCQPSPTQAGRCELVFEVCDTGRGIAPEDQQRICNAFEQVGSSLSPWQMQAGGTGLGLNISQALVQLMAGQLSLRSTPGAGSCFCVTLPEVAVGRAPVPASQDTALSLQDFAPARLLLADDQPNNLLLLQSLLSGGPFQLFSARNGLEACQLARQKLPDLILMDVRMPVMDGVEALKYLRADLSTQKIPLMALTAFSLPSEQQSLLAEGFDGYLSKPFNPHFSQTDQ
ncbi:MAG: PAS domain S-box protein [Candidatus Sericytochromatia bacterium]|nr:PAS domain S-box protein [Candidatus Sericytochromatia bacterium]